MKTMTVRKPSVCPASRHEVFVRLQKLSTLQEIARPYASFEPVGNKGDLTWEPGGTSSCRFRLFGFIPFGTHTIHVIRFSETDGIYTHEGNEHVPVWNHEIMLKDLPDGNTSYTDQVEIGAGWKTPFIWLWANCFYAHRQRKWIRMLRRDKKAKMQEE